MNKKGVQILKKKLNIRISQEGTIRVVFLLYSIFLAFLLFFRPVDYGDMSYKEILDMNHSFVPFDTIDYYLRILANRDLSYLHRSAIINLVGNIIMFIPLGFFLPRIFKKLDKFPLFILCYSAIIIGVELLQYFTLLGFCDIDDLILNVVGGVMGFVAHRIARKLFVRNKKNKM